MQNTQNGIFNLQKLREQRKRLRLQIDILVREHETIAETLDDLMAQLDDLNSQIAVALALREVPAIAPIKMEIIEEQQL